MCHCEVHIWPSPRLSRWHEVNCFREYLKVQGKEMAITGAQDLLAEKDPISARRSMETSDEMTRLRESQQRWSSVVG